MPLIKLPTSHLFSPVILVMLCYSSLAMASPQQSLTEIQQIAENGAPTLALRLMDRSQAELSKNKKQWMEWERQRILIYQNNHNWQSLLDRVAILPAGLPAEFTLWAQTAQAKALLELDQGTTARKVLHHLIISATGQEDDVIIGWLKQWRRLVILSYLAEHLVNDAHTAILRFQQDYAANDIDILLLRARVLLMNQQPQEVVELLAKHTDNPVAGMLYLLAQLRAQQRTPVKVVQAGLRQMRGKWADAALKISLWAVVAEAAQRAGDRATAVTALEHVLVSSKLSLSDKLFDFSVDSLWNAYIDYALHSGNKAQFLIGQDDKWFAAAKTFFKKDPLKARAFYALLLHRGQSDENRLHAAQMLESSLKRRKHGGALMRQLFTNSKYFTSISAIPEPVRRSLVDVALAQNDIPLASEIMATLDTPPKDNSGYMWYLRRARILVLGGQAAKGARALNEFVTTQAKTLNREQIDRLLQVVFDLQTVNAHAEAYLLFEQITALVTDEKLRRELFYWMAESRKAQTRYAEAAHLYLKSAMLPDGKGLDPWGQTARYQAAECLGQAGMVEDAYFLFNHLLRVTKEPDRRAVLQHEIHKLHLSKTNGGQIGEVAEQGVEDRANQ